MILQRFLNLIIFDPNRKFLDACAAPRRWKSKDGKWVQMVNWTAPENGKFEMDTGYTLRARELRDLYK